MFGATLGIKSSTNLQSASNQVTEALMIHLQGNLAGLRFPQGGGRRAEQMTLHFESMDADQGIILKLTPFPTMLRGLFTFGSYCVFCGEFLLFCHRVIIEQPGGSESGNLHDFKGESDSLFVSLALFYKGPAGGN